MRSSSVSWHAPFGARRFPAVRIGRAGRRPRGPSDRRGRPASRRRRRAARPKRRACRRAPPCSRGRRHGRARRRRACCGRRSRSRRARAPPPARPSPRDARPRAGTRNSSPPRVRRSAARYGSRPFFPLAGSGRRPMERRRLARTNARRRRRDGDTSPDCVQHVRVQNRTIAVTDARRPARACHARRRSSSLASTRCELADEIDA